MRRTAFRDITALMARFITGTRARITMLAVVRMMLRKAVL
jgi:hypothetical protein